MKLALLTEASPELYQPKPSSLNIFTTSRDDIKAAFDLMEFPGFFDRSMADDHHVSLGGWFENHGRLEKDRQESLQEIEQVKAGAKAHGFEDMSQEDALKELYEEYNYRFGPKGHCGSSVYGNGGWNRYAIRFQGDIYFSEQHAIYPGKKTTQNAIDLGFGII